MTGAYLRVKRDGKWQSIEVEHLTDDELTFVFADPKRDKIELIRWIILLCHQVKEFEEAMTRGGDE